MFLEPLSVVVELDADVEDEHLDYYLDHDLDVLFLRRYAGIPFSLVDDHQEQLVRQEVVVDRKGLVQHSYPQRLSKPSQLPLSEHQLHLLQQKAKKLSTPREEDLAIIAEESEVVYFLYLFLILFF